MTLTHPERRARRKQMAEFVEKDGSVSAAAKLFSVSSATIRNACLEYGVVPDSQVVQRGTTVFPVIAGLQRGERVADLAEQFKVTKQRVHKIKQLCKEHGIVLKRGR